MRIILMAAVLVAGCAGTDPESLTTTPESTDVAPFVTEIDMAGCDEAVVIFFIPPEQATAMLPEGFEVGDAASLLGLPQPTGRAGVLMSLAKCESSLLNATGHDEATLAVTVQTPSVPGERSAAVDLYEFGRGTSTQAFREQLMSVNWTLFGNAIDLDVTGGPLAGASGALRSEAGAVWEVSIPVAPAPQTIAGTFRWWHASDVGLSYIDYTLSATYHLGAPTCTMAADSLAAQLVGGTSCAGLVASGFVSNDLGDADVKLVHLGRVA